MLFCQINSTFIRRVALKKGAQLQQSVHIQQQNICSEVEFTPALKIYTISARHANEVFHVCSESLGESDDDLTEERHRTAQEKAF